MPYARITAPVDCKNPAWQTIVDSVVKAGNVKHLRGVVPEGLPAGGYLVYSKRSPYGRIYLVYNVRSEGRAFVIASVDPEYADAAQKWQPRPYAVRLFNFKSGMVRVHYDSNALPCQIEAMRQP